jgi:amidase
LHTHAAQVFTSFVMDATHEHIEPLGLSRRELLRTSLAGGVLLATLPALGCASKMRRTESNDALGLDAPAPFELEEMSATELQAAMTSGKYTSRRIVELYLARIEAVDRAGPKLNSILEINPDALKIAGELDRERKSGRVRGPLHGIPVVIKDNIDTADGMMTSAGSLALLDAPARSDAGLVRRLREAGAVIIAKANLSEWANIRSTRSTSGWSARGGLTRNPYALDRNTSGSSSGTGASIAASLGTLGIGTETDGSIVSPSSMNGLVGIKPTVGLVSRSGIVPISHSQDTAGPMCRTVRDAALLLSVIAGADPRDEATAASAGHIDADYSRHCDAAGLKGARIGVVRQLFNAGPFVDEVMERALAALTAAGAILVDPVEIPTLAEIDGPELEVLLHELKADLEAYLATRGPTCPHKSLTDLIRFNETNRGREMPYFGQELFLRAEKKGPLSTPEYVEALSKCRTLSREQGLDKALTEHQLDALIAPTGSPAWVTDLVNADHYVGGSSTLSAVAGYPAITVPAGHVFGLPVGITFMGAAWSEAKLVRLAYSFEQATRARKAPRFRRTADTGLG